MDEFKCAGCGRCCHFDFPSFDMVLPAFVTETTIMLSKPTLFIRDFEKGLFPPELLLPHNVFFDELNNRIIILSYTLNTERCPKLSEKNECKIYTKRLILCHEFPSHLMNEESITATGCPHDLPAKELKDKLTINGKPSMNKLYSRYGDSFLYRMLSASLNRFSARTLQALEDSGKIRLLRKGIIPVLTDKPSIELSELFQNELNISLKEWCAEELKRIKNTFDLEKDI